MNPKQPIAVLIDADNIGPAHANAILKRAQTLGEPVVRRAYGMVNRFSGESGWLAAQRELGIASRPQTANTGSKNAADIALAIDAMELAYDAFCRGILIVSSDSDYTALAVKVRERGKSVWGMGEKQTPAGFRTACTAFFELPSAKRETEKPLPAPAKQPRGACPRCGRRLVVSSTILDRKCHVCESCGGVAGKLSMLDGYFAKEGLAEILKNARERIQPGCICPYCGKTMSILRIQSGDSKVEVDVCGDCSAIWYDKNEFEALVSGDRIVMPSVSAGKAYRREKTMALAADLRNGRLKAATKAGLSAVMRTSYRIPKPDIEPIIQSLASQRIIAVAGKTGKISVI